MLEEWGTADDLWQGYDVLLVRVQRSNYSFTQNKHNLSGFNILINHHVIIIQYTYTIHSSFSYVFFLPFLLSFFILIIFYPSVSLTFFVRLSLYTFYFSFSLSFIFWYIKCKKIKFLSFYLHLFCILIYHCMHVNCIA